MEYSASIGSFRGHLPAHRLSLSVKMAVRSKQSAVRTVAVRALQFGTPLSCSDSLYDVLRLPRNAKERDIKSAYRQMALRFHPDVCPPEEMEEATRLFVQVREAYETLSDPALREDYDWRLQNGLELSDCDGRIRMNRNSLWEAQLVELMKKRSLDCYRPSWGSKMRRRNQQTTADSFAV
uniref:TSA: Wollemia nobilis Ref_Wollemi_Transcript_13644_872 transcribed RNA sequence n=1 Tax=Wollemia nobilis TaxID=56998 RepID=A0A0C9RKJ7_9CONI